MGQRDPHWSPTLKGPKQVHLIYPEAEDRWPSGQTIHSLWIHTPRRKQQAKTKTAGQLRRLGLGQTKDK